MTNPTPPFPNSGDPNPASGPRPATGHGHGHGRRHSQAAHFYSRLGRYRSLLRRRGWILLVTTLLALGVQYILIQTMKPMYVSSGRMIVAIKLSIPEGAVYTEELSSFYGTQTELMRSDKVRMDAASRLAAEHPELLPCEVKLRVTVSPRTSIFNFEASGDNPEYVRLYLQACMDSYLELRQQMRETTSEGTLVGLSRQVLDLELELRAGESQTSSFLRTNNVVFMREQRNSAASRLTMLENERADLDSEHKLLTMVAFEQELNRADQDLLEVAGNRGPRDGASTQAVLEERNPQFYKAKQELIILQTELADLGQVLRPRHPKIEKLVTDIERQDRLLAIYRAQSLQQLDDRKSALLLKISNLDRDIAQLKTAAVEINAKLSDYEQLERRREMTKTAYERLLSTIQTLDVNKSLNQESVSPMQEASVAEPDTASTPKRLALAGVVGLALGLGILKLLDRLDDRMNSHTELMHHFDEIVLGQIPRIRFRERRGETALLKASDDRHSFVEAYRNLRSSLHFMIEGSEAPRLLLVTSSVPNDGKSVTAANLAITMAATGSTVLLVDADLRKGNLHASFLRQGEPGLAEVLSKSLPWREAIRPTPIANLSLLPRGKTTSTCSELFLSQITIQFLREVKAEYDYVLIDTAPVMAADDVTSLAPHTEGVLFVLRADHTSARVARAALDSLYQRKVRVLGLIFNAVRTNAGEYYYYYKYRDYYATYPAR
jgi:polysaccharide biosynthesis transport protein